MIEWNGVKFILTRVRLQIIDAAHLENTTLSENAVAYHEAWRKLCSAECVNFDFIFKRHLPNPFVSLTEQNRNKSIVFEQLWCISNRSGLQNERSGVYNSPLAPLLFVRKRIRNL